MRKNAILILFVFISASFIFPQSYKGQGRIQGIVTDEQGMPLEGVKIKLFSQKANAGLETVTDAEGRWRVNYVRGGGWNLDFEKLGYAPHKLSTQIQESGQNKPIEVKLKKVEGLIVTEELKAGLVKGNTLFDEKKYDEAAAVYEELVKTNPEAYIVYQNIGNCYFQMEKYDRAEEFYKKVLDKDPKNAEAMLRIGNCYTNRGELDKALEWYNKIEFDKITDQMVLFNIGSSFYKQSKYDEAVKYYKRAIEIQADFLDAIYQLGLAYVALQNNADALKAFESYLKHDADSARAGQVKQFIEFLKKK
ncbi:MAG: tetratricopeptide repeat protein [Candidatus Aminicenantes bacterium]|nr:tetratricopeptide repeat protein [Candidatus Aminicenantes bacterium]